MLFALATLSENVLPASHVLRHSRSLLTFSFIVQMLFEDKEKLASSAYILTSECLIDSERSYIYIMNSNGPKHDPCGTPQVTSPRSESLPFTLQHCFPQ